jgi:hypothetical protein
MSTIYKIHPAIGIARLGTAQPNPQNQQNYYLAPTEEGALPTDPSTSQASAVFRDPEGKLLKQAAQFQVFAYEDGKPDGEPVVLGSGGIKAIEWTAYLANKKAAWYQFKELTGSGQAGDAGYTENNKKVPPLNPLRVNRQVPDRQKLILDPGPRTVGGSQPTSAIFDLPDGPTTDAETFKPNVIRHLGSLYAEKDGTLLIFGGDGSSGTTNLKPADPGKEALFEYATISFANNEGWFDDVADGPVDANLILEDGRRVKVDVSAWCLIGPPKFAPQVVNIVTLFDTIFDVAVREQNFRPLLCKDGQFNPDYKVDFEREIAPLLRRPDGYRWTVNLKSGDAITQHQSFTNFGPSQGSVFPVVFLRKTDNTNGNAHADILMPRLAGDNPFNPLTPSTYLTLTQTQFFMLQQWIAGKVEESVPDQAVTAGEALDFGVLANCVGGAFCPGIEITWISRNPHIYSEPFRINAKKGVSQGELNALNGDDNLYKDGVEPGDLGKYQAQPWQADYNECSTERDVSGGSFPALDWWWWPPQRPYNVFASASSNTYADWTRSFSSNAEDSPTFEAPNLGDMQMIIDWQYLGFLKEIGGRTVETDRLTELIEQYKDPKIDPPPP